jgi:hypothetical protein
MSASTDWALTFHVLSWVDTEFELMGLVAGKFSVGPSELPGLKLLL